MVFLTDLFKAGLLWLVSALCKLQRGEAWVRCFVRSVLMFLAVAGAQGAAGFLEVGSDFSRSVQIFVIFACGR